MDECLKWFDLTNLIMKKSLLTWVLPFLTACGIILIIRSYFIQVINVDNNEMNNTLLKGDKVVLLRTKQFDRNTIVSLNDQGFDNIKRLIAKPMDTIFVKASYLYVNRVKVSSNNSFSFVYSFSTDSISKASKILKENKLEFNPILATIGIFQFNASIDDLKKVQSDSFHFKLKRLIDNPSTSISREVIFHPSFYWNKDHFGPFIVPGKGVKVRINKKMFYIYKQVIEQESGKKLEFRSNLAYLANSPLKTYTFKKNYYFLLNDNWNHANDSRTKGFVDEEKLIGKYWFKLPW